jgi:hypothetical protein
VQRAPVRTVVGVQWVRGVDVPLKLWDFELWALGTGRGRVDAVGPNFAALTLMEGTGGVTDVDGALCLLNRPGAGDSFTDIVGMSGVTFMEGAVIPLLSAGVSLTDMLGIGGAFTLGPLLGAGVSLTDIIGISGVTDIEGAVIPLLSAGASLTDMLGIGGETPIEGTFTAEPRRPGPLTDIDGVSETDIVGMGGAGVVLERVGKDSDKLMVGNGVTEGRVGMLAFLSELVSGRGRAGAGGSS